MIITGAILVSIAGMIAIDNLWNPRWSELKFSLALEVVGFALIVAGIISTY